MANFFPAVIVREGVAGGKNIFALRRPPELRYRTPPGPRALYEVGLAAWFLYFAVRFSPGYRAPAPHPACRGRMRECGRG
jgi:hypothetical protein